MTRKHDQPPVAGPLSIATVHVHVSNACNLRCTHCYSESAPGQQDHLAIDDLATTLQALKKHGYEHVAISGGEPFLYPSLGRLIAINSKLGLSTSLATNGSLIDRLDPKIIKEHSVGIAISLDGKSATHNDIRNNNKAFIYTKKSIDYLNNLDIKFGLIHCLTRKSALEIPWLFKFARDSGSEFLQIHPIEIVGAATNCTAPQALNTKEIEAIYIWLHKLRKEQNFSNVYFDISRRSDFVENKKLPQIDLEKIICNPLSQLINPIVIKEDGSLLPICYNADISYKIGNIYKSKDHKLILNTKNLLKTAVLMKNLKHDIFKSKHPEFFNFYEEFKKRTQYNLDYQ